MPRPKGEPRKQTCFTLDESLINRLEEYSKKSMVPKARVVDRALKDYLDRKEKEL